MVGFINYFLGEFKMRMLKRFIKDERGLESSEYALLLALIALGVLGAVGLLTGAITGAFDRVTGVINTAAAP